MSDKKKSSKNTVFYGVQDPAIAKAIFALMLVCVVFVFALSIVFLVFTVDAGRGNTGNNEKPTKIGILPLSYKSFCLHQGKILNLTTLFSPHFLSSRL